MVKVALLIDGGNVRVITRRAGFKYDPTYIETVAQACIAAGETLLRVLYYDCAPYNGKVRLPVSGEEQLVKHNGKTQIARGPLSGPQAIETIPELLTLEQALAGAMQTGKPPEPEPQNKHA